MGIDAFVHPKAHVEDATIGEGTRVWQFASVIRGASIGKNCIVASCSIIDGATLGDDCLVGHGASLNPGLWCGSKVFIGPNATICNDRWPAANKDGFDLDQFKQGLVTVFIHDGASIGANAAVLPGMTIGKYAMIAAGCVVNRSVPDGHLFGRDGKIVPIKDQWRRRRMFAA